MTNHEEDFLDRLGEMFELQGNLQRETYGSHPSDIKEPVKQILPGDQQYPNRIGFIKDMKLALEAELQEFLDETGWKPWATSRHINFEAAQGELVDAFHFFMNLAMAVDMTPDMLYEKYKAKRLKNIKRQQDGYDGVGGKCPHCKRALDDDAVKCQIVEPGSGDMWALGPDEQAVRCDINGGIYILRKNAWYQVKPSAIAALD